MTSSIPSHINELKSHDFRPGDVASIHSFSFMDYVSSKKATSQEGESMDMDKCNGLNALTLKMKNKIHKHSSENKSLPSFILENFKSDDDDDEDENDKGDRLYIDDGIKVSAMHISSNNSRSFSCHLCNMATSSARTYTHHLKNDHGIRFKVYDCDLCDYTTIFKHKLQSHKKKHISLNGEDKLVSSFNSENKSSLNSSKVENSFANKSLDNSMNQDASSFCNKDELDDFDDEDDCDTPSKIQISTSTTAVTFTGDNADTDETKKKKKTRQEVDPGKYFEAIDSEGTKYACSQCGNIYKWRKSLNKHWKEKHVVSDLLEAASPPGMVEILKTGKYTQLAARRIYEKNFLATIKTNKIDINSAATTAVSPNNIQNSANFNNETKIFSASPSNLASPSMPINSRVIGPFVSNSGQPVFPGMPLVMPHLSISASTNPPKEEGVLDLSSDSKPFQRFSPVMAENDYNNERNSSLDQEEPLDFSKSCKSNGSTTPEMTNSTEPTNNTNWILQKQYHCSKCEFTCNCESSFANHTNSHMNKKNFTCFDCKLQIPSMEELNSHFIKFHFQKLSEYKDAVKKIPHGLQQAYHVLNMNIQDIGELSSQDLRTTEGKSLKCKKCNFEAKWPAELQKHAVSHSEERPYICMICGSTYKWKWDLVKHFQKSHPNLPNPYRRNDKRDAADGSSDEDIEPSAKRLKLNAEDEVNSSLSRQKDISLNRNITSANASPTLNPFLSNLINNSSILGKNNLAYFGLFPFTSDGLAPAAEHAQESYGFSRSEEQADKPIARCNSVSRNSGSSNGTVNTSRSSSPIGSKSEEAIYKCTMCNYHARWPSEVAQHMKNHSDCKPYWCPRCEYRSKWKWDVVKHLKRCGGGTIKDVIDTTKLLRNLNESGNAAVANKLGKVKKKTIQQNHPYVVIPTRNENFLDISEISNISSSSNDKQARPSFGIFKPDINTSNIDESKDIIGSSNDAIITYNTSYQKDLNPQAPGTSSKVSAVDTVTLPSSSPSNSATPTSSKPTTSSSRQSSTGQAWNCPHCPFMTHSQAELKRHSDLHSDDKPFKCDMCHYSTRWACDLKKHRKGYNHYPKTASDTEVVKKVEKLYPRFKCSQCVAYFETFDNLLQHRTTKHINLEPNDSLISSATNEMDIARIKHPRKQVKQFQCPKCPFICKNRQTMEGHIVQHEQIELTGINCFYCSVLFKDKESLLDHIITHTAFDPKEWETFFMMSEEEQYLLKDDKVVDDKKEDSDKLQSEDFKKSKSNHKVKEQDRIADSTEERIKQILNEIPKQMMNGDKITATQFQCEWCPAEFVNLMALYKHASYAHPAELQEQDADMNKADNLTSENSGKPSHVKKPAIEGIEDSPNQKVIDKKNHPDSEKYLNSSDFRINEYIETKKVDGKDFNIYDTVNNYCEVIESRQPSQCWFCDFTVDQMNLLYQHMKISHIRKWKAMSQNPKYSSYIRRISQAFDNNNLYESYNPSTTTHNHKSGVAKFDNTKVQSSETSNEIVYVTKQQYTWSAIPVNIVPVGNAMNFVCPHCEFQSALIADTCSHVMQSHQAMSKYICKICQFSNDNIHIMYDHCRQEHLPNERIVEVIDFKQISYADLQIVHMNALKEQILKDNNSAEKDLIDNKKPTAPDLKPTTSNIMHCPFCPYKTLFADHMKAHISGHNKQGSFQCNLCDFSSDSSSVMNSHINVHDSCYTLDNKSLNYTGCSKKQQHSKSGSASKVKKEPTNSKIQEFTSEENVTTSQIFTQFKSENIFQEEANRLKSVKKIRYRCSACPYKTTCRSNALKHTRQHINRKKYKCPKCSYSAARAVLLKNHTDSHDMPVEDKDEYRDIFCDPNNPSNNYDDCKIGAEMEDDYEDNEDDDVDFDDVDDEMDAKAIADLEAKDILEATKNLKPAVVCSENKIRDNLLKKNQCSLCPFVSMDAKELHLHVTYHSAKEKYRCDYCSYSPDKLDTLFQHRQLHSKQPGYTPNILIADLLNRNFIDHSHNEQVETGITEEDLDGSISPNFSCKLCPYKNSKKELFEAHCAGHGSNKIYICDFCDWSTIQLGNLHKHRKVHKKELNYNAKPEVSALFNREFDEIAAGEFEAKLINSEAGSYEVKNEQREVNSNPPFKLTMVKKSYACMQCPFKSNSKNSFEYHKSMHGSGLEFNCSICSYAAMNRGLLQQHMRLHAPVNENEVSLFKSNMIKHEESDLEKTTTENHSTAPLFKNNDHTSVLSGLDFSSISELKCQRCPFTGSTNKDFIDHIKGHMNSDSLKCPFCDFSATSRHLMFPHIQIHFPGKNVELEALEKMMLENMLDIHKKNSGSNGYITNNNNDALKPLSPKPEQIHTVENEIKTKRVYVCQFCEREFEAKLLMIQHEKQHLVGRH